MTSPTPIAAAAGTTRGSRSPRRDLGRPERDPWDVEYDRDVWRLRLVGVQDVNRARITFEAISQKWLKELAKRWARWRLVTGSSAGSVASGTQAVTRFALFLSTVAIEHADQLDRALLERYLAYLHAQLAGRTVHRNMIGQLGLFFTAIGQHGWTPSLPAGVIIFPEDVPKQDEALPRALSDNVMAQLEHPDNLARWTNPDHRLVTLILMRCGLRITDALCLPRDCVVADADGAPYLRYLNHKMDREALVPIDEELERAITTHRLSLDIRWPNGTAVLFPMPRNNPDGQRPTGGSSYRQSLHRWLKLCDIKDEHGQPVSIVPHRFRHTLGTQLINRDVPQEVVRRILDHDSHMMTARYARLSDTTIRRHWERARKVNINGEVVLLDPAGPLAEAAWAKQRISRATQALPNGFCGLPVQKTCPHANACLTCPMFLTTPQFLPQHHEHRQQVLQIITAAEARGQQRLAEMNHQVLDNLDRIITALADDDELAHGEAVDED